MEATNIEPRECKITKFPACLNQGNFRVVDKEGDGAPEEIRFRLEISVENNDIVTLFDIVMFHAFLQSTRLVTFPVVPYLILYIYTFACPSLAFCFHQSLQQPHKSEAET